MSLIADIQQMINITSSTNITKQKSNQTRKPKITYIIEPTGVKFEDATRVIAIAYSYDNDKNIKYGASIFRKLSKKDICVKSQIRDTAIDRFNTNPVCFTLANNLKFTDELNCINITNQIRYKMYKLGVKGRNVICDSIESTQNNNGLLENEHLPILIPILLPNSNDSLNYDENNKDIDKVTDTDSDTDTDTDTDTNIQIDNELSDSNYFEPRITYILEPKGSTWSNAKRIIAIAYSYSNNHISFGSSIFRRDFVGESCVKADIRSTALERFYSNPVCLKKYHNNDDKISVVKVLQIIRKTMYTVRKTMHTEGVKN